MIRVLVVDDEVDYCDEVQTYLSRRGYKVRAATAGPEAIEVGCRFRPNVLVTDWLLQHDMHGLSVWDALWIVDNSIQSILMTGFHSQDLECRARSAQIFEFIEKPFRLQNLERSVRAASHSRRFRWESATVAVMEINPAGQIVYSNSEAKQQLFPLRQELTRLEHVLDPANTPSMAAASEQWTKVFVNVASSFDWYLHTRRLTKAGDWLLVLCSDHQPHLKKLPAVRSLLGLTAVEDNVALMRGHALVVAESQFVRDMITSAFRSVGCLCHSSPSLERSLELFQHDHDIEMVVVDDQGPTATMDHFIEQLRGIHPHPVIVHVGRQNAGKVAKRTGYRESSSVSSDLERITTDLLGGKIGTCDTCHLPVLLHWESNGSDTLLQHCQCRVAA